MSRTHNPNASSYLDHAIADAEQPGGRFAKQTESHVAGLPTYPRQPAGSPWAAGDPTGDEPPLGVDVNAMEPNGTAQEIEKSIRDLGEFRRRC